MWVKIGRLYGYWNRVGGVGVMLGVVCVIGIGLLDVLCVCDV